MYESVNVEQYPQTQEEGVRFRGIGDTDSS